MVSNAATETGSTKSVRWTRCDSVSEVFRTCSLEAMLQAPWIQPSEYDIPITVCRGIKKPILELWPLAKSYHRGKLSRPFLILNSAR
jgi:hypothetical protein